MNMKRKRAIVWLLILALACMAGYWLWAGILDENSLVVVFSAVLATVAGTTALLMWLSK